MHVRILCVGTKMPSWVEEGFDEYSKRFPSSCNLQLVEIPLEKRTKQSDMKRLVHRESEKLFAFVRPNHFVVALDVLGKSFSTEQLAKNLENWQQKNSQIDFLIGGPDGIAKEFLDKAHLKWSLSPLTLPHPIVRIILAEQLYRALMIIQGHPYHR